MAVLVLVAACDGSPPLTVDDIPPTIESGSSDDAFCAAVLEIVGDGIDESQLQDLAEADLSPSTRTEEYAAELKLAVDSFVATSDQYFIDTMGLSTLINEICGTEIWGVEAHSD